MLLVWNRQHDPFKSTKKTDCSLINVYWISMYVECQLEIILHYFIKVTWYIKSDNCGTSKKKPNICVWSETKMKRIFNINGSEGNLQTLWCIQKKPCLHFILVFLWHSNSLFKKIAFIKTLDNLRFKSNHIDIAIKDCC